MNIQTITDRRWSFPGILMRLAWAMYLGILLLPPAFATPDKAAKFYEDALARYEKNDMPGAVIQLKNALKEDQKMLAAHLLLGKALLKNGELKGAEAAFEEALKQGVNRGEVALPLGQVYLALGRPEAVIERISASGLPPALQVEVLTMRGNAYNESFNTRLATQSFDEARAIDPKSASPLIAEIPMLIAAGQLDRAKENAAKAVELAPNNANAWNMKASVSHASFDMAGALFAYDKALTLEPRHVDARVARAGLLIDLKREADARKDLDFLRTSASDEPRAAYLRAVLAGQQGDGAAVVAALTEVTKSIDALPPVWLARREQLLMAGALAHHGLGNLQKARDYLNLIVSRNSRNLGAKKLLASIYLDMKDYGRALSLLEPLQKSVPEDPQVMFLLGSVHMAQGRYLMATELIEKAATRTGSAEMNRTLAFSQLGLGRVELGQASLEKAFAANPADSRAGTTLSMLYMRQGQAQKALQTAEAMVKRDPTNLTTLNFLGSVKGATGDKAGARAAYTAGIGQGSRVPSIVAESGQARRQ
ncbi:MAG: tetratricopeptide repeat protein [Sulfuritalea sp.]|nr:tetratricopeptide repeat protein [Sulfuritalea sp.]